VRRLVPAILFLATAAFVPPKRDVRVEIAGVYRAVGTHPDGSSYEGQATLTRLSQDRYSIRFDMPNGVFRALCVRSSDLLGCAWGSANNLTAVVVRGASATFATDASNELGRENVAADGSGAGVDPAGSSYTASWSFTKHGSLERVVWTRTVKGISQTQVGWGLRNGAILVAGFPMPLAGAAFYRIESNGTQLSGEWMDPLMPDAGVGTELLTH
jgi:hypothetical protein